MEHLEQKIDTVDKAVTVGEKAAKSVQQVPIGWMFVIMMVVIAVTTFVSYQIINKSFEGRISDCQTRVYDLKKDIKRYEDYFVFREQALQDTVAWQREEKVQSMQLIREKTKRPATKILNNR